MYDESWIDDWQYISTQNNRGKKRSMFYYNDEPLWLYISRVYTDKNDGFFEMTIDVARNGDVLSRARVFYFLSTDYHDHPITKDLILSYVKAACHTDVIDVSDTLLCENDFLILKNVAQTYWMFVNCEEEERETIMSELFHMTPEKQKIEGMIPKKQKKEKQDLIKTELPSILPVKPKNIKINLNIKKN